MTDDGTTYDAQGLGVRLTGERSLNGAQALGYPLDVRPDPAWPGLSGAAGELRADHDEMDRVAGWLESRSADVQTLPQWLSGRTAAVRFGPPSWHEANNLADACGQLTDAVTTFVAQLAGNMTEAAGSVRAARANHVTADDASADAFRALDSGVGGPSSAGGVSPL
jgi:hypothetical protein